LQAFRYLKRVDAGQDVARNSSQFLDEPIKKHGLCFIHSLTSIVKRKPGCPVHFGKFLTAA
jgi:hypothetical protein